MLIKISSTFLKITIRIDDNDDNDDDAGDYERMNMKERMLARWSS